MSKVLVVDDEPGLRQSLGLLLTDAGYHVAAESDGRRALERAVAEPFDLILCDVRMPELDGLSFLRAYGGQAAALAAMQDGAYDYIPKPFRPDEVVLTLRKAEERERLRHTVATLRAQLDTTPAARALVAESRPMRQALELVARVAEHKTTVLITGAAGDKAGLFEQADGGTLLLDEIGELPLGLQAKLLRVLQEGEIRRVGDQKTRLVDVRLLAATARDLAAEVAAGRFREDLYYRLNVVTIHLPPLAERREDVRPLARHFAAQLARRLGRAVALSDAGLAWLEQQPWPGNVRELEHSIERAAVLSDADVLEPEDLTPRPALRPRPPTPSPLRGEGEREDEVVPPLRYAERGSGGEVNGSGGGVRESGGSVGGELGEVGGEGTLRDAIDAAERQAIEAALRAAGGNRREAAKHLGVSLRTLFYKMG